MPLESTRSTHSNGEETQSELAKLIASLTPEQVDAVEGFIGFLRLLDSTHEEDVRKALDEFTRNHSELLRR